ncbi:hypothetical protein PF005_g15643 [Phytophthora fragariae]|uniref:RxLR effector protein n=1 Tax=Phytophthora fragariae TaxID=53985 RepID=A0A6A3RMD7_9STRA|nr:hypothetical protein PF003_g34617 [Phytophthora fragariae]KAE8931932.1 hypothetical protein PF009_g18026 [Phytophthora fragariae]KAE8996485.1 hypothetical protein PF011_g15882 [Phytophthora fragariae]KAE9100303.1 hypothetical protein PF007_g15570 [Phytophthora fragariae]KAE9102575.1 hypothetical protein PF010_g14055 [Phytophthora fragariae]
MFRDTVSMGACVLSVLACSLKCKCKQNVLDANTSSSFDHIPLSSSRLACVGHG